MMSWNIERFSVVMMSWSIETEAGGRRGANTDEGDLGAETDSDSGASAGANADEGEDKEEDWYQEEYEKDEFYEA